MARSVRGPKEQMKAEGTDCECSLAFNFTSQASEGGGRGRSVLGLCRSIERRCNVIHASRSLWKLWLHCMLLAKICPGRSGSAAMLRGGVG